MTDGFDREVLASFAIGNYTDAFMRLGMRGWARGLAPLAPMQGRKLVGAAVTVRFLPVRGRRASSVRLYEIIRQAKPGDILVIQAPYLQRIALGSMIAKCAQTTGLAGMVVDGYVRDAEEIRASGFPLLCRGIGMEHPAVLEIHDWNVDIDCAGAQVRPGDFIVGDDDGIVVIPPEDLSDVVANIRDIKAIEDEAERLIVAAAPLEQIHGLLKRKGASLAQPGKASQTR